MTWTGYKLMSDCVYHAWVRHLIYLDSIPSLLSWELYKAVREYAGNSKGFTYGGIIPALVRTLSGLYGYSVRIQYRIWTPEMYEADVRDGKSKIEPGKEHRAIHFITDMVNDDAFGEEVDRITLEPAVYLLLNTSHAVFSETVPRGGPVMALQVYREQNDA